MQTKHPDMMDPKWAQLNSINLTEFFPATATPYHILECKLQMLDCAKLWKLKWTFMGSCLALDNERAYRIEQKRSMIKNYVTQKIGRGTRPTNEEWYKRPLRMKTDADFL